MSLPRPAVHGPTPHTSDSRPRRRVRRRDVVSLCSAWAERASSRDSSTSTSVKRVSGWNMREPAHCHHDHTADQRPPSCARQPPRIRISTAPVLSPLEVERPHLHPSLSGASAGTDTRTSTTGVALRTMPGRTTRPWKFRSRLERRGEGPSVLPDWYRQPVAAGRSRWSQSASMQPGITRLRVGRLIR